MTQVNELALKKTYKYIHTICSSLVHCSAADLKFSALHLFIIMLYIITFLPSKVLVLQATHTKRCCVIKFVIKN